MKIFQLNRTTGAFEEEEKFEELIKTAVTRIDKEIELNPTKQLYAKRFWLLLSLGHYFTVSNKIEKALSIYLDCYNFMHSQRSARPFWNSLPYQSQLHIFLVIAQAKFQTKDYLGARGQIKTAISLKEKSAEPFIIEAPNNTPKEDEKIYLAMSLCFQWHICFLDKDRGIIFNPHYRETLLRQSSVVRKQDDIITIIPTQIPSPIMITTEECENNNILCRLYANLSTIYIKQAKEESDAIKAKKLFKKAGSFCKDGIDVSSQAADNTIMKQLRHNMYTANFKEGCCLQKIIKKHDQNFFKVGKLAPNAIKKFTEALQQYLKYKREYSTKEDRNLLISIYFNRGRLLLELGIIGKNMENVKKAKQDLERAKQLSPNNKNICENLNYCNRLLQSSNKVSTKSRPTPPQPKERRQTRPTRWR